MEIKRNRLMKRLIPMIVTALLMMAFSAQTVFASSYISSISITVDYDLVAGENLDRPSFGTDSSDQIRISNNSKYDIVDAEWEKQDDEIRLGKEYYLKVTLETKDGYKFRSGYSDMSVRGAEYVSSSRKGYNHEYLQVRLRSKPAGGQLDMPDNAYWQNKDSGVARWSKVDNAAYELRLYRGTTLIEKRSYVDSTSFNFYPYMTKRGSYTFKVRAIPRNSDMDRYIDSSEWTESDDMYIDENEVSDGSGQTPDGGGSYTPSGNITQVGWVHDNNHWYFRYPDGSYLRNSWAKINNRWYLFDNNGMMNTGWQMRNNIWYYMTPAGTNGGVEGAMHTGWLLDNGSWFYLNPAQEGIVEGSMRTGWLFLNNMWYYMNPDGRMAEGWKEVNGNWYFFYPGSGHMAVNTYIDMFYVNEYGVWNKPQVVPYR